MSAEIRRFPTILTAFLLTTTLIVAPESVRADDTVDGASPFYIDLGAGAVLLSDTDIEGGNIDTEAEFDIGPAGRIALGHAYDGGWRAELELGARLSDIDSVGASNGSGDVLAINAMVNGYYDVDLGGHFTPYVGLGIGAIRVDADGVSPVSGSRIDDDDVAFAYQGILGGAYAIDHNWSVTADYRYLASTDLDLSTASGTDVDPTYRSHSVFLGIRLDLGALGPKMQDEGMDDASSSGEAAAISADEDGTASGTGDTSASAAGSGSSESASDYDTSMAAVSGDTGAETAGDAAASGDTMGSGSGDGSDVPDLARAYRVLFDLDSADLTDAAEAVLQDLAENAEAGEIIRIEAIGHTDSSGSQAHNMALSKSRAVQVKAALVRMGVPPNQIVIYWKGENDLLVDTGDGVPHPDNRRVEIVFPE